MKILVVAPVPMYATRDVWMGHVKGLKALGAEVLAMDYAKVWQLYADFHELSVVTGRAEFGSIDATLLASERIFMAAVVQEVDLVYMIAPMHVSPTVLKLIARLKKITGTKLAAYFTESPYDDDSWQLDFAELVDFSFVCDSISVPRFRERNPNSFYVGHAYDPDIHYSKNGSKRDIDCLCVTTLFPSRTQFLEQVDWTGINLQLFGILPIGNRSPLHQYVRGSAMVNEDTVKLYRRTKVGFTLHRNDNITGERLMRAVERGERGILGAVPNPGLKANSLGPRAYELAACGVFQICDGSRRELQEVFGDTVPVFDGPEQFGDLLRQYIDDPVRREEAAKRQQEAVQPYTFSHRMKTVLEAVS